MPAHRAAGVRSRAAAPGVRQALAMCSLPPLQHALLGRTPKIKGVGQPGNWTLEAAPSPLRPNHPAFVQSLPQRPGHAWNREEMCDLFFRSFWREDRTKH